MITPNAAYKMLIMHVATVGSDMASWRWAHARAAAGLGHRYGQLAILVCAGAAVLLLLR